MANARRTPMTVDPVTGELRRARVQPGKHTSGCMQIDEKYLHAARDAGLGGSAGMYGHMSVFKRTGADVLRPSDAAAASGPGDLGGGVAPQDVAGAPKSFLFSTGHGARAGTNNRRTTLRERVGANNKPHHSSGGKAMGAAKKRGGNVRHMVQGRSHRVAPSAAGDSAFSKSKGVVAGLHGVTNVKLHNQKARQGVAGRSGGVSRPRARAAGTKVHTTSKGGQVHMLSHASERSCRAGGPGVSAGAAARGSSVMSGGIRVTAPASKRPAASSKASGSGTKGRRSAGGTHNRANASRPAPVAGRRAATKPSGGRSGSGSSNGNGSGSGSGSGSRVRRKAGSAGAGAAGRTLGGTGAGGAAAPKSAAELRAARAKYFDRALGAG